MKQPPNSETTLKLIFMICMSLQCFWETLFKESLAFCKSINVACKRRSNREVVNENKMLINFFYPS